MFTQKSLCLVCKMYQNSSNKLAHSLIQTSHRWAPRLSVSELQKPNSLLGCHGEAARLPGPLQGPGQDAP